MPRYSFGIVHVWGCCTVINNWLPLRPFLELDLATRRKVMDDKAREDVLPHSVKNPPSATSERSKQVPESKFFIAPAGRPGQVVASMAKRPIKKG
jgi:hypothetical protein